MADRADKALATHRPGFGRVDLVVAIACLGALAAMAIPRQQELSREARRAELEALAQGLRSAARFGHALWLSQGGPAALALPRGRVAIIHGYPAPGDLALLLEVPETMGFVQAGGHWQHDGVDGTRRCGVDYVPPVAAGAAPVVATRFDGC